jgi:hypothetical protein
VKIRNADIVNDVVKRGNRSSSQGAPYDYLDVLDVQSGSTIVILSLVFWSCVVGGGSVHCFEGCNRNLKGLIFSTALCAGHFGSLDRRKLLFTK